MAEVLPLPYPGDVFADIRGGERTMRVSFHADGGVLVVSLWAGGLCRSSFRMSGHDIDRLAALLDSVRTPSGGPAARPLAPPAPAPEAASEVVGAPEAGAPGATGVPDGSASDASPPDEAGHGGQVEGTGDVTRSGGPPYLGPASSVPSAA